MAANANTCRCYGDVLTGRKSRPVASLGFRKAARLRDAGAHVGLLRASTPALNFTPSAL